MDRRSGSKTAYVRYANVHDISYLLTVFVGAIWYDTVLSQQHSFDQIFLRVKY